MMRYENHIQDSYKSVSAPTEGLFKDNGSRFIARVFPVNNEGEIKELVDSLKKEYHDARHHCYAYRLGHKGDRFRANDDGEPSSSAGRPILGQIDSFGLSDILIVVIRYFGGIKLGLPGLIRAYKTASADALSKAQIIEKTATSQYSLSFGYESMNSVMNILKDMELKMENTDFGEICTLDVLVRLSYVQSFEKRLNEISGCSYSINNL